MRKYSKLQKVLAMTLTLVMVIGLMPTFATAVGEDSVVRSADASTLNKWRDLLISDTAGVALSTENAGGVWTDKSVFAADAIPAELANAVSEENTKISVTDTGDNFLVALSAIASNKEITGYSTIPTDTVFILDMSSSMRYNDDSEDSAIDELADATNKAITDLLALNKNNRIAVVLYAGNTNKSFSVGNGNTQVILPLASYTPGRTTNGVGQFLEAYDGDGRGEINWNLRVCSGVKNAVGTDVTGSKESATGTFMQDGIYEAMRVLLGTEDTVVESGVQAGTTRMPIMVLMTDGEPTMANNDYNGADNRSDLGQSVMHDFNNYNHRDTIAFMTQLTAAFAKKQVEAHYETDALFYTLAYGEEVTRLDEALSVMDPEQTSNTLNDFWSDFLADRDVLVYTSVSGRNQQRLYVRNSTNAEERLTAQDKFYVDEYFPAETDDELYGAFEDIVDEIIIQSKYYPTYVQDDHDHDGYITFADKIGGYMKVTNVHGIVIGDTLCSGALLARGFEDGTLFGTVGNPTDLGNNLVWSVQERLGIIDVGIARQLLMNAYNYGQLSYTSDTEFSNYIGWYSDANGHYIDFWYEGADTTNAPAGATHIVKSYGMLGQTDKSHGISAEDMMYASIRVSTELNDYDQDGISGETMLTWQIPASLVPTLTYKVNVDVNNEGEVSGVNSVELDSDQVAPIRLLYEIALQENIHEWNIAEIVNDAYVSSDANKDAGYVFYTNQWNKTDATLTTRNTYSHFEPSVQNERYYYTEDTLIYTDTNGTVYSGSTAPSASGTYYRQYKVYEKMTTGTYRIHEHYEQISAQVLSDSANLKQDGSNWYVLKGTAHRYYHDYELEKDANTTATLNHYFYPLVENSDNHYYSHVTLGNNGKLIVTPATGIKVTKTLTEEVDGATNSFDFTISGGAGTATLIRLDENGEEASRQTLTFTAGEADFTLAAEETVYIIGLTAGTEYTVSEGTHKDYSLDTVKVDGTEVNGTDAEITAVSQTIQSAEFVNTPKGEGGLYIAKEVTSDTSFPADAQFDLTVALAGNENTDIQITASNMENPTGDPVTVTGYTYANGKITGLKIQHGQTIFVSGLTEGTIATVTETDPTGGFELDGYTSICYSGDTPSDDNSVTIYKDKNATVVVKNTYTVASVDVTVNFSGTKKFDATNMTEDSTFTFKLQQNVNGTWTDVEGKTVTVTAGQNASESFTFSTLNLSFDTEGVHSYQIIEEMGENTDITYDRSVYTFSVNVTDNGDGTLKAEVVPYVESDKEDAFSVSGNNTTGWTVSTTFTNEYHTTATNIDIVKTVEDNADSGKTAAGFKVASYEALLDETTGLPVETNGKWTIGAHIRTYETDAAGETRFVRNYDNSDFAEGENTKTYYFIISEIDDNKNGWSYDATQYQITVNLTKADDGEITATFVIDAVAADGTITQKVTAAENANSATLTFKNTFTPDDVVLTDLVNVIPTVMKQLTGRPLEAGEFTFQILENGDTNGNGTADEIVATGKNLADGAMGDKETAGDNIAWVNFTETTAGSFTFTEVGIYHYKVREVIPTDNKLGGVTYDGTIYDMVVTVTEDDGELVADYFFEDATTKTVTFQNTYDAANTDHVIEGTKSLTGRNIINAEFRFDLVEVDASFAVVSGGLELQGHNLADVAGDDTVKDNVSTIVFPAITYTKEDIGDHYYRITEVNAGETLLGVTHDTAAYVVKVTVKDNGDGTLGVSDEVVSGGTALSFSNVYVPEPTSASLSSSKTLTGRVLEDGEFTFTLTQTGEDYDTESEEAKLVEEVKNDVNGKITFKTLDFNTPGDFYYVVEETAGNKGGVTYDATKYYIHINVADNYRGKLVASTDILMVVEQEGENGQTEIIKLPTQYITFHNNYTVSGETGISLSGTKVLDVQSGKLSLTDGLFTFVILDEEENEVASASNKGSAITFPELTFDAEDCGNTYVYTIVEKDEGKTGVTYSDAVYTLEVTVSDKDGEVVVDYELTDQDNNMVANTALNFTNVYEVDKIPATIQGKKTLSNATLTANAYTFDIYPSDSTFEVNGAPAAFTKNAEDGSFSFTITELDAGTYYYVIKERIPDNKMSTITYDQVPVHVTVTVTDLGGQLSATVSYTKAGELVQNAAFTNIYTAPSPVTATIYLEKTVVNKTEPGIGLDGFTFLLKNGEQTLSVQSDKDGKAGFQMTFTLEHVGQTYELEISEKKGSTAGVTYDDTVHKVKIAVAENADGTLKLLINDEQTDTITLSFTNIYEKSPTPVTGDNFPIYLVATMMILSAAGIVLILLMKRKKTGKYAN